MFSHVSFLLFDLTRFYELILFSFLTGNGDLHLKNFSLLNDPVVGWKPAPGYDLLNTRLVIPDEFALSLTGKKSDFNSESFEDFGKTIGLNPKQIQNIKEGILRKRDTFLRAIEKSFLSVEMKSEYKESLKKRYRLLEKQGSGFSQNHNQL